jgi:hypothetical protein
MECDVKKFYSYEEIPLATREYLLLVADAESITDIPLQDINGFLYGLHDWEKKKLEEWSDGWVE